MPKAKQFVTKEGDHLDIDESGVWQYIGWFIVEHDSFGQIVGEGEQPDIDEPPEDPEERECWLVYHTIKPLADGLDSKGFRFESERKALAALKAANEALLKDEKPWPEWAIKAKAAGWTPPKKWKP